MKESGGLQQPAQKTYTISPLRGGDGLHDKSAEWEDGPAMALFTGPQDLLIHVRMLKTYGNTYKSDIAERHRKLIGN